MSFTALFAVVADFGLSALTIREVARDKKNEKFVDNCISLKLLLSFVTFFLIFFSTFFIDKSPLVKLAVIVAGSHVIISNFNVYFTSIYKAFERMESYAKVSIINGIAFISLLSYLIFVSKSSVVGLLVGYITVDLLILIINVVMTKKGFFRVNFDFNKKLILKILKEAWPLALGIVFTMIYVRIDSVMLSFIKGDKSVGIYAACYNLLFALQGAISIVHHAILPKLSTLYYEKQFERYRRLLKIIFKISLVCLFPLLILLSLFSKEMLNVIYGPEFTVGYVALIILFWNGFIIYFSSFYGYSLMMSNRQRRLTLALGIGAVINITLNFALIPGFGYIGAAIATIITEIVVMVTVYFLNDKRIRILKLGLKEK
jgi:O-antigen/teichoic acid export membrane protein